MNITPNSVALNILFTVSQHLSAAVFGMQSLELSWLVILLVVACRNCWLSILIDLNQVMF